VTESTTWSFLVRNRRTLALVALCVGSSVLEAAVVLARLGGGPSRSLSLQANAVAPLALFHDLRWLAVSDTTWPLFVLSAVALLAVRGAMVAASVRLAWPAAVPAPSIGRLVARGVASSAGTAVLLAPSTALLFGMAVVPISWLFIAAVPGALLVGLVLSPVAIRPGWWRRSLSLAGIGWVTVSFVVLTVGAAVVSAMPAWAVVPAAAVVGAFDVVAWRGLVRCVVTARDPTHVLPVLPAALVVLIAGTVLGSIVGFTHAAGSHARHELVGAPPAGHGQPVEIVAGYGSSWDGSPTHPIPGPFLEEHFSYRGVDGDGHPLPYEGRDTVQALAVSVRRLAAQVESLHRRTHLPVSLVAESEGALVAEGYVLADPHPPVSHLVLLSPLVAPGQVSYPVSSGNGAVMTAALSLLGAAYRSVSPVDLSPTNAFLRSVDELSPAIGDALLCPAHGVTRVAVLPLADATAVPPSIALPFPSVVVPAFHGGLLAQGSVDADVGRMLLGASPHGSWAWHHAESVISAAATAWQVPRLAAAQVGPRQGSGPPLATACPVLRRALAPAP
jgi:hypothetical protein